MALTRDRQRQQQRRDWDTRRPNFAVYRRRRRMGLLVLAILTAAALGIVGAYLTSGSVPGEAGEDAVEQIITPTAGPAPEAIAERAEEEPTGEPAEEEEPAATAPQDPTMFLTVPKLGLYQHTVRNDRSEAALDLGAIKLPEAGFPWSTGDNNTYIACHRIGFPGTESFNQCLNLPLMQEGDEIFLTDTNGEVYEYQVNRSEMVTPDQTWITRSVPGEDVVSLQTCIENIGDIWTMGPDWNARYVVQAVKV